MSFSGSTNLLDDKKILIVDDEPDIIDTLEDLLPMCRIVRATNFQDAKRSLDMENFDLAILDIMGVEGYNLLDISTRKDIITVMLTARALGPENVSKSFNKGAAYYVPKEEMIQIEIILNDILKASQKGESTWQGWIKRMSHYCERNFKSGWQKQGKIFWEKFPFY